MHRTTIFLGSILAFASCAASEPRTPRWDREPWSTIPDLGVDASRLDATPADARREGHVDQRKLDAPPIKPDLPPPKPDLVPPKLDKAVIVSVPVNGDCVDVTCPPGAPHPLGCDITFSGGSAKACVAWAPGSSTVYFQEGNNCTPGQGNVAGVLFCSSLPGAGPSAATCPIKPAQFSLQFYELDKSKCPN